MVPDESPETADDSAQDDARTAFPIGVTDRPARTLAIGAGLVSLLAYAILIQQELVLVVWLGLAAFFAHLALRFVRAVERNASASERLAHGAE